MKKVLAIIVSTFFSKQDFLDLPCHMVLVIQFTQSAQLLPVTTFPLTQLKSKGECLLKFTT